MDDKKDRSKLARMDDAQYRATILKARRLIYKDNVAIDSIKVERELKPQSLVPTEVFNPSHFFLGSQVNVIGYFAERLFEQAFSIWVQHVLRLFG